MLDYEELKNTNLIYREKLNIPSTILFGTEIEFSDALIEDVIEKIKQFNEIDETEYFKTINQNTFLEDYSKWKCIPESTVQYEDVEGNIYGGEINSPILNNTIQCFKALKSICDILNITENLSIDSTCSLHIHIDRTIYANDAKTFLRLLKLWMLFEDIIYRFSYGEIEKPRPYIYKYANPINKKIYRKLNIISKYETHDYKKIISDFKRKDYGLTFFYAQDSTQQIKNTIETRMFNGTTNEIIIQNDINFIINLLLYAKSELYDDDYINYEIKRFKPMEILEFSELKLEKAAKLADMIFQNETDKVYFMKQYVKKYDLRK